MPGPGIYKNVQKAASDLIKKGFVNDNTKLSFSSTSENGVDFSSEIVVNDDTDMSFGIEFKPMADFTVSKCELQKAGRFEGELKYKGIDNATVTLAAATGIAGSNGDKPTDSGSIAVEYGQDAFTFNSSLDLLDLKPKFGLVFGHGGIVAGGSLDLGKSFDFSKPKWGVASGYNGGDYHVALSTAQMASYKATYYHKVNKDLSVGAVAEHTRPSVNKKKEDVPAKTKVSVGVKYVIDSDSTLNVKVADKGEVTLGLTHKLKKDIKLTAGTTINAKSMEIGTGGFGLAFSF